MPDAEVTVAVLGNKIDNLTTQVEGFTSGVAANTKASNERLRFLETEQAVQRTEIDSAVEKVEKLDKKVTNINLVSKIIGGIASGLAVLAAAIGISK